MKVRNSKETLENFNPEELEQRFEMGWKAKKGEVKYNYHSSWDGIK